MVKNACKLLRCVLCNFYLYYCLFGFASSGLYEPESEILGLGGWLVACWGGPALRAGAEICTARALRATMALRATAPYTVVALHALFFLFFFGFSSKKSKKSIFWAWLGRFLALPGCDVSVKKNVNNFFLEPFYAESSYGMVRSYLNLM